MNEHKTINQAIDTIVDQLLLYESYLNKTFEKVHKHVLRALVKVSGENCNKFLLDAYTTVNYELGYIILDMCLSTIISTQSADL
jgi:hypothetical protein